MSWQDFRAFIVELEKVRETRIVEGADCDLEIGSITELMCERRGPMLIFDSIKGYPTGFRIATKPYATVKRNSIALGISASTPYQMFTAWRDRLKNYRPVPRATVVSGSVMENVLENSAVDLLKFPVPKWHEEDGGAYFGTGCTVITKDPDDDWVNVGTYRCMLHDEKTTGIYVGPYHHGNLHMKKWWSKGESCPVAVAVTVDPYLFFASSISLPWKTEEYEYAGFLKGQPVETITGPRTGLPFPSNAELVFEGRIPPPDTEAREEGPFGEFTGYYAGNKEKRAVIRVEAIYHRENPILQGDPPLKPPIDHFFCPPSPHVLSLWESLERHGVQGIEGVFSLNSSGSLTTAISIRQQYDGHAKEVGKLASSLISGMTRLIIVLDEDIDPSNSEEVLWAIATRTDPENSFHVEKSCKSGPLDPMILPAKRREGDFSISRMLITACRPWGWKDEFPKVNRASDTLRNQTLARWSHLFESCN